MAAGFTFHGVVTSQKHGSKMRRIPLRKNKEGYPLRPSLLLPSLLGTPDEVEQALFSRRWGVPGDAWADVFGREAMCWYRTSVALGRSSIVGTTVTDPAPLPQHRAAEEKPPWIGGSKGSGTTTAASDCMLGGDLAASATTAALTAGYRDCQPEALALDPTDASETVNTEGWTPTPPAWECLFPLLVILRCFFHVSRKIRACCTRDTGLLRPLGDRIWHLDAADTPAQCSQRVRRRREWAESHLTRESVREKVLERCRKAEECPVAWDFPEAYRTRNAVDRVMNDQDRLRYAAQYFHGTTQRARLSLRASALVWHFHPYGTKTRTTYPECSSPWEKLHGFRYHDHW
jgi:hypothetical protein